MKKSLLLLFIIILIRISSPVDANATMPAHYPIWGYNTQNHICQIKQKSEESRINEKLEGHFLSMQECRRENPEIIFYTGEGILIWLGIFVFSLIAHYLVYPKLIKRTRAEKAIFHIQDIIFIGIALFFIILLAHYFEIPRAYYPYSSDIDHIIYSFFIRPELPLKLGFLYIILSFVRGFFMYRKNIKL